MRTRGHRSTAAASGTANVPPRVPQVGITHFDEAPAREFARVLVLDYWDGED
jgi:hypothetical protein